jgi:uncharacterized protein (DUF2237 family)
MCRRHHHLFELLAFEGQRFDDAPARISVSGVEGVCGWVYFGVCVLVKGEGRDACVVISLSLSADIYIYIHTHTHTFSFIMQEGYKWCLCASRWQEACDEGVAPQVVLKATHIKALDLCNLSDLISHAMDPPASHAQSPAAGGEGKEGGGGGGEGKKEEL